MFIELSLFFLDIFCYVLLERDVIHILLLSFIVKLTAGKSPEFLAPSLRLSFFLLLLEDILFHGRFGISLLYLIPIIILGLWARKLFITGSFFPTYLLTILSFLGYFVIVGLTMPYSSLGSHSTIEFVLINVIIMTLFLKYKTIKGARGNRFLVR